MHFPLLIWRELEAGGLTTAGTYDRSTVLVAVPGARPGTKHGAVPTLSLPRSIALPTVHFHAYSYWIQTLWGSPARANLIEQVQHTPFPVGLVHTCSTELLRPEVGWSIPAGAFASARFNLVVLPGAVAGVDLPHSSAPLGFPEAFASWQEEWERGGGQAGDSNPLGGRWKRVALLWVFPGSGFSCLWKACHAHPTVAGSGPSLIPGNSYTGKIFQKFWKKTLVCCPFISTYQCFQTGFGLMHSS